MEPILAGLARFVASLPHDAIPGAVRDHAALVVADTVGAILGGSQEPRSDGSMRVPLSRPPH